jgi:protoporphyrinogen oxidase
MEARDRLVNGVVLERGPDSFLTEKPAAAELCRELGLGTDLIPSNDAARKTYILVKNRLVALPDGLMFLVPTKLIPTALTRLFSLTTKIRMGLELLHPPRPSGQDESVAALVERHFGAEAVDRLADPLLSGIYGGDAAQLSARTVLPRLVEMENEYGSLTRGMLAAHRKMRARPKRRERARNLACGGNASPARRGQFLLRCAAECSSLWMRLRRARCRFCCGARRRSARSESYPDGWKVESGRRGDPTTRSFWLRPRGPPAFCSRAWTRRWAKS